MGPWSLLNVQRGTWVRVDRWSDGAYKDSTAWPRASNKQRTMVAVLPSGLTSFPDSWGDAVTCKPGERQRWSDGNVVCLSCASGLFSNRANQTACLSCAAGFYAQRPASTGAPPALRPTATRSFLHEWCYHADLARRHPRLCVRIWRVRACVRVLGNGLICACVWLQAALSASRDRRSRKAPPRVANCALRGRLLPRRVRLCATSALPTRRPTRPARRRRSSANASRALCGSRPPSMLD
jgi:hypothetical protein